MLCVNTDLSERFKAEILGGSWAPRGDDGLVILLGWWNGGGLYRKNEPASEFTKIASSLLIDISLDN